MYTYIYMSGITNEVYALYTRVFLNSLTKEYETIITIDRMPSGQSPLRDLTMQINLPSLSPFQPRGSNACANTSCAVALKSLAEDYYYVGQSRFMTPCELPTLFTFLMQNGYIVDTNLTQVMSNQVTGLGNWTEPSLSGKLVCYISKYIQPSMGNMGNMSNMGKIGC